LDSQISRAINLANPASVNRRQSSSTNRVDSSPPALEKVFDKRRVVRNVSLKLQRGEAVGLLGPNGAGKTTTFHILAGLLPADEGNVQIDGRDITGLPVFQRARLGIGYLPQESSIFRGLTVEQNIRAVLETLDNSRV
jgi:lipopolysaccharide export system ATP-binding protein